ncbi:MAG: DNA methyltransferase [Gammaproteobacteria bacterium WSBS_2016_MAG_OTU1]
MLHLIQRGKERIYPECNKQGKEYRVEEIQQRKNIGIKRSDKMVYSILKIFPQAGYRWTIGEDGSHKLIDEKRIFVKNEKVYQIFYKEEEENFSFYPLWANFSEDCSTSEAGKKLLDKIVSNHGFETVKPVELIQKLIFHFSDSDSIIMDSFAGSGTTAHAVLQQNKEDGGKRKFLLVEMEKEISENITAKRIQKVIKGYGTGDKKVMGLGGGFRFCTLGSLLLDEYGNVSSEVKFSDLAAHVFFSGTGMPIPKRATTPLLGEYQDDVIYLLYNGIMGDKSKNGGNVLTPKTCQNSPPEKIKDLAA